LATETGDGHFLFVAQFFGSSPAAFRSSELSEGDGGRVFRFRWPWKLYQPGI
jgi:hypothetical protein